MTDDLVNRLHEEALIHSPSYNICNEAADRIEKLEAALKTVIHHCEDSYSSFSDIRDTARKALEGKDD